MAAGAAYSYGEAVLALLDIARNQLFNQLGSPVDELFGNIVFQDVLRNFFIISRQLLKAGHIIRVGDKAHVQSPVGFKGYAVLVAEGHDVEDESAVLASFGKKPVQLGIHLRHLEGGSVDDVVSIGSQLAELSALLLNDLFGDGRRRKRMGPAGFVVSPDQCLVRSLYEKNFKIHILVCLQGCYAALEVSEKPAAPHVDDKGRLFYILGARQRKVYEIFYESRGHVVDTVIALVLKPVRRLGFAGAGKSRDNYYFHQIFLSFPSDFLYVHDACRIKPCFQSSGQGSLEGAHL